MLIQPQSVKVKWSGSNRKWYESKGYGEYKHFQTFTVNVEDLMTVCAIPVEVICDYCKIKRFYKRYHTYLKAREEVPKDCCDSPICQNEKREDVLFHRYGKRNAQKINTVREKTKATNLVKYGAENVMGSELIQNKIKETNKEKYGVEFHMQTDEWKNKIKENNLEKYGVENISQIEDIKLKRYETNLQKYGYKHVLQNPDIKSKANESLFKNGTQMTSKQQCFIHNLIGGELNYPYYTASLDIAFPEDKVYIEFNGGGHDLSVKLGSESEEDFNKRSRERWYSLYREGWKEIRIVSLKDKLPADEVLLLMFNKGKEIISQGRSWVIFDIDNGKLITNRYETKFDFGQLRSIY